MAYKIQYSPEETHRYPQYRKKKPVRWHRWILAAVILISAGWLRFKGLPDVLIPGDKEVTVAAAKNMVNNLRHGTDVKEVVTVFCKEILREAGV